MTDTNKITPGPWCHQVGSSPHYQGQVYSETTGATIAVTYNDEDGANARAIAAAPDLIAALERIEPLLATDKMNDWTEELEEVRYALEKAGAL